MSKVLLASSALLAVTVVDARQASALITIDNIGSSTFPGTTNSRPLTGTNWAVKTFTSSARLFLTGIKAAFAGSTTAQADRTVRIGLYSATEAGTPAVSGCTPASQDCFRPTGNLLATTDYTAKFTSSGNATQALGGGYTTLTGGLLGSLGTFLLQANVPYALVFSSGDGQAVNWRSNGSPYSEIGIDFLNSTGTGGGLSLGSATTPITLTGASWQATSTANLATNALTLTFAPVPAPALAGGSSLIGLLQFSRRLRRRIQAAGVV